MTTIIIGLFPTQKEAKSLATDLETKGFANEDYIVYLNKEEKQEVTFWDRLFGGRTPQFNTNNFDHLIASVAIKNEEQLILAKEIFEKHSAVHSYEFNDVTIKDAESLNYLKTKVALHAKSEVYASELKNKNAARGMHHDLTNEFSHELF